MFNLDGSRVFTEGVHNEVWDAKTGELLKSEPWLQLRTEAKDRVDIPGFLSPSEPMS